MTQTTKQDAGKGTRNAPSRRDEILAIAGKVIAERGIKDATVRDIGEAAGILSGSLYYHFESKDQIVLELLLPGIRDNYEKSRALCEQYSGLDAVAAMIRESVLSTAASPDRSVILRNEARLFGELPALAPVNEFRRKIIALWLNAVEQGMAAGEIRATINPEIIVRAILDGTLAASRWFNGEHDAEPSVVVESMIDFYIGGLKHP